MKWVAQARSTPKSQSGETRTRLACPPFECVLLAFLKVEASKFPTWGLNLDRSPRLGELGSGLRFPPSVGTWEDS